MELPRRDRGDELLKPNELTELRSRLRKVAPKHDLTTVIACAFDHRTRMLPFIFADTRMVPAGVRAVGSALVDVGCERTRIVLQQWNKRFRPSQMRLDGRIPDLFMVSSMGMHQAPRREMISDARRIDETHRPLIILGGSQMVYEPFEAFSNDPSVTWVPDVVTTGEEFVLLSLLEVLLEMRAHGESMRSAFTRARDSGALDSVLGLVYPRYGRDGVPEELVDTGMQRLVGNLDELPHPIHGYRLLEPPSRHATLGAHALPPSKVSKHSPISSIVMTFGCKFACPYCPIPAYNQRQFRTKSPERIADEMDRLNQEYGLKHFFGTDDNFFNHKDRALEIAETLARTVSNGSPLRKRVEWATEVTVHDVLKMKEHLPIVRDAGCRALWMGVEDLTATLVKKGQSVEKTHDAFQRLCQVGICPMPMMMHHDSQPLYSRGSHYGLLNQIHLLREAGAVSLQVLMLVPSPGTKLYFGTYTSGQVFDSVGGRRVDPYMHDGNYVIASHHKRPWIKQLNILTAYVFFYNPVWLTAAMLGKKKSKVRNRLIGMQLVGMLGATQNIRRTFGWAVRLLAGKKKRLSAPPVSTIPMRSIGGGHASHDMPSITITIERGRPVNLQHNSRGEHQSRRHAAGGIERPVSALEGGNASAGR